MIIVNGTLHGYNNTKEPSPCVSCVFTLSLKAKVVHMRHWAFSSHPLGIMKWYYLRPIRHTRAFELMCEESFNKYGQPVF